MKCNAHVHVIRVHNPAVIVIDKNRAVIRPLFLYNEPMNISISGILLAAYLVLQGMTQAGWIAVPSVILGLLALGAGIFMLIGGVRIPSGNQNS